MVCASVFFITFFSLPKIVLAGKSLGILEGGLLYYGSSTTKSLQGVTGNFVHFVTSQRKGWFKPNFGAQIEMASGNVSIGATKKSGQLLAGNTEVGFTMVAEKADYVKPYINFQTILGWASLAIGSDRTLSITYGGMIVGGAEIRFSARPDAVAFRLSTGYRMMMGKLGGVSGFELHALQLGFGFTF